MRQTPSGSAELTPGKLIKLTKEQEIALRHWRDSNEGDGTRFDLSGEAALSIRRFTPAGFPINLGEDQPLFRTNCRISAGASGWRYHRHTPNVRRGYAHYWIDARGRTQNTIRSGQLVSEKLVGWVGCAVAGLHRRVAPAPLVW